MQFWFPYGVCLEAVLLGGLVVLFLVFFQGLSILSSIVAVSVHTPTSGAKVFPFLHTLSSTCCFPPTLLSYTQGQGSEETLRGLRTSRGRGQRTHAFGRPTVCQGLCWLLYKYYPLPYHIHSLGILPMCSAVPGGG